VDVQAKLDQLTQLVENARSMPMSASCVVNRAEVLALVDEVRELLPGALREAQWVLKDREEVVEEGRKEGEQIVAAARVEATRLVSRTEIMQTATREAERVTAEATENAKNMRLEVEDYVDTKLANFEVVLHKTLTAVERGRDKLRGRHELDQLSEADLADLDAPLPGDDE
jgi:cell division septum initiation protein DivIVA